MESDVSSPCCAKNAKHVLCSSFALIVGFILECVTYSSFILQICDNLKRKLVDKKSLFMVVLNEAKLRSFKI